MNEFDKIYLAWREGAGNRRHIVGCLERRVDGSNEFYYLPLAQALTDEKGFIPYTEFPDLNTKYIGHVVDIFAQRLIKPERLESRDFYSFWEVDRNKLSDKFYLLGKTQGLVSTDNFEFLAEYKWHEGTIFVTEIAGLSHKEIPRDSIKSGDILTYICEPTNEYDPFAVQVLKDDLSIGYIKKIHNKIFHDLNCKDLKIVVKAVEQNGKINKLFIKVFSD